MNQFFTLGGQNIGVSASASVLSNECSGLIFFRMDWLDLLAVQGTLKIAQRNINNLRYADDTTLMAESEEELKSLFIKVKEESEKA